MGSLEIPTSIGFIGLGAMGLGMASDLQRRPQYSVTGFDIWPPSVDKFVAVGGHSGKSPRDVAQSSQFLICMAATAQQLDSILFESSAIDALPRDATVVLCSTVPPTYYDTLPSRIADIGRPDVAVVDAPVSGGTLRAANGTLTIFAAGSPDALSRATSLLHDMSERLYIISGGLGAGSKVKMINQLLVGTHIAAASEAIAFATKAGLDTTEVFDIIQHTSGSSWAWDNRVPHMLEEDWTPLSALNIFVKDMGIVVSTGRAVQFPLPIASVAEQLYISGAAQGFGKEDDAGLVRLFLQGTEKSKIQKGGSTPSLADTTGPPNETVAKVTVLGLDTLGRNLAVSFSQSGFNTHVFDADEKRVQKLIASSRTVCTHNTPAAAAQAADILVVRARDINHATDLLFGPGKVAEAVGRNAVVLLSSTVSCSQARTLERQLRDVNPNISLLDAPVCDGGSPGKSPISTMLYSGSDTAVIRASGVLLAANRVFDNVRRVSGGPGSASTVKLIDQLLAGIQLVAAAEAMAFASHLGLDGPQLFELLRHAAAWSWMFECRVPTLLKGTRDADSPLPALARDLGLVLDEAKGLVFWAPLTSAAHNVVLAAESKDRAGHSSTGVVRLV
ncbi:NAD-binding of NADP-dependent 3-hydroxyisobutyrate dehydrogenase-domain-containing protein [Aspergillus granulosus]|uniref:NAD-binding of NADP-dependent 3-hydroxyisobutyrate dehydrogenase-domain-containing protein n=1 Tax=Aspergillus granulosus TaxID=176169 RepID=A0ABR4HPY3_9EURO